MLKLEHVAKHYKEFDLECTMEVPPGCVTGLIGKNGAGKSTTFKAILGLIRCDSGSIHVFGKPAAQLSAADKQQIGVVLSDSGFGGYLTIQDLVPVLCSLYPSFRREDFLKKCRGLSLPLTKKIKEFSTGMKQKRSILISSHISGDLEGFCDDLYMIDNGKIILHEDTDVLLSDYAILKMTEEQFGSLDKAYILRLRKEPYGYSCLTNQKQFYLENHPEITVERGNIDELILMMAKGQTL